MHKKKKKTISHRMSAVSSSVYEHVKEKIGFYTSALVLAGMIFGAPYWLDNHYASAADLKSTNSRLEQKILEDKFSAIESHIWAIQDHYKNLDKAPPATKQELRDLQDKKDRIKNRLDVLDKEIGVSP